MTRRCSAMLKRIVLILLCGTVLGTGSAFGQQRDRYYNEMRQKLLVAGAFLSEAGYSLSYEPYVRLLDNRRYQDISYYLGRTRYAIIAVGDDDARDIDLQLFNQQGQLIAQDKGIESVAMIEFPSYGGSFTVRVIMENCVTKNCYVGVGVFARR